MSNRLEQFIKNNREAFDDDTPSSKLWNNIESRIIPEKKIGSAVVKMNFIRWSAAAAALVLIVLGIWFMMRTKPDNNTPEKEVAGVKPATPEQKRNDTITTVAPQTDNKSSQQLAATTADRKKEVRETDAVTDLQNDTKEEMVHYAKLVEIKQRELKTMTKDEPLLYKQFAEDVNKLDSVYHSLENKLSKKQNSEELLEAMIQNLQLQMQLLNKQLGIIKQLNHSKKSAYEKAYQSI
ncbi:MAG TPA: hypothetical protein VMT76_03165 [Puia sp.]|nr:hypothetical protein [Puia sp.]